MGIPLVALAGTPTPNPVQELAQGAALRTQLDTEPMRMQEMQAQIVGQQQQNQQRQIKMQSQQAVMKAVKDSGGDFDKALELAPQYGATPDAVMGMQQHVLAIKQGLTKLDSDKIANMTAHNDRLVGAMESVTSAPPEDQAAQWALARNKALREGDITDPQAVPEQYPGPDQAQVMLNELKGHSALFKEHQEQQKEAVAQQEANAKDWKEFPGMGMLVNVKTGEVKSPEGNIMTPGMAESRYLTVQQNKNQGLPVSKADLAFAQGYERMKSLNTIVQNNIANSALGGGGGTGGGGAGAGGTSQGMDVGATSKRFGMTPAAFDQAANKYLATGQLPQIGRGASGIALNRALMDRAGEIDPNASLAANAATQKANAGSLAGLQKQFDQVTAFENTAGKNLDVFLGTAKKVLDAKSPWINTPLRKVDMSGLGSDDMAAFNAARTTALTEIAKVLNSSNASGVLSDSARHEVEGLIGPGATLKQIISAANILKTDMGNRHQSYQDQINAIQGRMKTGGSGGNNQTVQPASGGIQVKAPNGKTYNFPDQASANKFKQAANIQ